MALQILVERILEHAFLIAVGGESHQGVFLVGRQRHAITLRDFDAQGFRDWNLWVLSLTPSAELGQDQVGDEHEHSPLLARTAQTTRGRVVTLDAEARRFLA